MNREFWKIVAEVGSAVWSFNLDEAELSRAFTALRECKGNVVVTGIGKAGLIGRKACATLASTGTQSIFLSPTDALHGDLGVVGEKDVVIALTNSGSTSELLRLMPHLKKIGCTIITVTGERVSETAKLSDIVLGYGRVGEAGKLGLAPTTSTTVMLVIMDALALTVMEMKGFGAEDYARYHPGGALGGKALLAKNVMRTNGFKLSSKCFTDDAARRLAKMHSGLGVVTEPWDGGDAIGIITIAQCVRLDGMAIVSAMTEIGKAVCVTEDMTVATIMKMMRVSNINQVPVLRGKQAVGVVDIQDIIGLRLDI